MSEGGSSCKVRLATPAPAQSSPFNAIRSYLGTWIWRDWRDFPLPTRPRCAKQVASIQPNRPQRRRPMGLLSESDILES